ncbi:MAG: family 1 glycosylhydrolase, partial [Candidatus Latescibacteria bacterium]|nr:family 1 glycosylhydrolase [bacterium]MBD3424059.1 family 1 glycosylhydrolase [Candidatus Latescibacterota bacterium]
WVIANLGHLTGEHAPGHTDPEETLRVAHHLLLSHGWAVRELRSEVRGARAGIVVNIVPPRPATESPEDLDAARRFDGSFTRWYLDPIYRGSYPPDAVSDRIKDGHFKNTEISFVLDGDMEAICTEIDFLGINYYNPVTVRSGPGGKPELVRTVPEDQLTEMGWEVCPEALYEVLVRVQNDYNPEQLFITENGAAFPDDPDNNGRVHDIRRVDYFREHLKQGHRAIADGVKLAGYFAWSLMDNFEWAHGYTKRFGLFRVEFDSQKRYPKDSAYYFRNTVQNNAVQI